VGSYRGMFGPNEDRITRPTRRDFRPQVRGGLALLAPRGANLFVRKFAFPAISALLSLLYVARTGITRRDLPREFGKWDTIDNRYRRWLKNGTLQRLFELLTAHPELAAIRRILLDATNVRAHRCAAGAPKKRVCLRAGSWSESGWILDEDGAHCGG
jgi:transposase